MDTLSFDTAPHSYDDAVESLGRITDALINHGPASLGPIIIIAPATDAIANVIAVTVANLLDWRAFDDDDEDPAIDLGSSSFTSPAAGRATMLVGASD